MASQDDILTAHKNLAIAMNKQAEISSALAGNSVAYAISVPTVLTPVQRLVSITLITAGSANGMIYDTNILGKTTAPIGIIPSGGSAPTAPIAFGIPISYGIYIVPGTGQQISVNYSRSTTPVTNSVI